MERSTILIIDPAENSDLKARLEKRPDFKIIGSTDNVDLGFTLAERYQPALILLNVDLPGDEGFAVAEVFVLEFPASSLVLMTASDNKKALRQALRLGAKDVINLPAEDDRLYRLIQRVLQQEMKRRELFLVQKKERPQFKTIAVFSTKGGVGKSTVALNLAVALRQMSKKRVALVDLDLFAGNLALMAGVAGKRTIKDLVDEINDLDKEMLDSYCSQHPSGLRILAPPLQPELSGFIEAEHIEKILDLLSQTFNYVVIDAPSFFHDTVVPALEMAREIILVTTLDLAAVQNLKQCFDLLRSLSMHTKARVVVNRAGYGGGLKVKDLEEDLGVAVECVIPNCERQAVDAVNMGQPLILSAANSGAARQLSQLAARVLGEEESPVSRTVRRGLFGRRR